jgi:hypothetical protein
MAPILRRLLPLVCVLWGTPLWATPIAFSSASLDWPHWTFTVSGPLVISQIDYPDGAPPAINVATATLPLLTDTAMSTATASAVDGMLSTSAKATVLETETALAHASTLTMENFWLYGSGSGTVTVSVPYAVQATCSSGFNEAAEASAGVFLEDGPGVRPNGYQAVHASCGDGPLAGILSVSLPFDQPTWGPLVDFMAGTTVMARATIPDSGSSVVLLVTALLGLGLCRQRVKVSNG